MAQQKFRNAFREALWETYGKKCFYCTRELLLVDMRVDHVIPEHLHHGIPSVKNPVLNELGLPAGFNILGRENLAPSCDRCNSLKSGDILIGTSPTVELTRIRRTLPKLEENLRKKKKDRELEDVLLTVGRSIELGKFTSQDFLEQFVGGQ
jgi:5-methylcytosine-specific restriction endonuclease McrA